MALPLLLLVVVLGEPTDAPTYRRDIEPILRFNCTVCHSEKDRGEAKLSGGISLEGLARLRGEKDGRLVRPGNSQSSLLLQVLLRREAAKRMPKDGEPLTASEIDLIRRWIDGGCAEGDAGLAPNAAAKPSRFAGRVRRQVLALPTVQNPPAGALPAGAGGPLVFELLVPRPDPVAALAWVGDDWLAAGTFGRVCLWNLKEGRLAVVLDVPGHVHDLRASPDGKALAIAGGMPGETGWVRLVTAGNWEQLRVLAGHKDVVSGVAFHPQEPLLLTASQDKTLRLWDWRTGELKREFTGHSEGVTAVAFAGDGQSFFSASRDRTLRKFNLDGGKAELTYSGQRDEVLALAVAPESGQVLSGGLDRGLSFWSPRTAERTRLQPGGGVIYDLAVSARGQLAATVGQESTLRLWNVAGGSIVRAIPTPGPQTAVALTADGGRVAAGGSDGVVRLWETRAGRPLATLFAQGLRTWLIHSPDGYFAAAADLPLTARLGEQTQSGRELRARLEKPDLVVQSVAGQRAGSPTPGRDRNP
jgi:WD40 repeat protein